LNIYDAAVTSSVAFDISYGHRTGSAAYVNSYDEDYEPDQAIYGQYANLCLPDGTTQFTLDGTTATDEIFVINFNRTYLKDGVYANSLDDVKLTVNSTELNTSGSDSTTVPTTGPNAGSAYYMENAGTKYGIIYPKLGTIILNKAITGITTGTAVDQQTNISNFYDALGSFTCKNEERISTTHYFCRLYNDQYNFTNNPTWQTGSAGLMKYSEMYGDPQVYVTTIGMYDDNNNLLATAKLNKPQLKNFERELLVKVRIQY